MKQEQENVAAVATIEQIATGTKQSAANQAADTLNTVANGMQRVAAALRERAAHTRTLPDQDRLFAFVAVEQRSGTRVAVIPEGVDPVFVNLQYVMLSPVVLLGMAGCTVATSTRSNFEAMAADLLSEDDGEPPVDAALHVVHIADLLEWRAAVMDKETETGHQLVEAIKNRDPMEAMRLTAEDRRRVISGAGLEPFRFVPQAAVH